MGGSQEMKTSLWLYQVYIPEDACQCSSMVLPPIWWGGLSKPYSPYFIDVEFEFQSEWVIYDSHMSFSTSISCGPSLDTLCWGKGALPCKAGRKKDCWQMVSLNLWIGLVTVGRAFLYSHRILHHHWHLASRTTVSIKPHWRQPWTNFSGIGNEISKWTDLLPEGGHQHAYSV